MSLSNTGTAQPQRDSDKLAMAAHLHVLMRRKLGRVTDVEWLVRNDDYAREVIRVALADPAHTELMEWAHKLQAALFPAPPPRPVERTAVAARVSAAAADLSNRYIGRLR
jgi:hypothetical protein